MRGISGSLRGDGLPDKGPVVRECAQAASHAQLGVCDLNPHRSQRVSHAQDGWSSSFPGEGSGISGRCIRHDEAAEDNNRVVSKDKTWRFRLCELLPYMHS